MRAKKRVAELCRARFMWKVAYRQVPLPFFSAEENSQEVGAFHGENASRFEERDFSWFRFTRMRGIKAGGY